MCIACWKYIPNHYRRAKNKVYDSEYANKYLTDVANKTQVKLYCSLGGEFSICCLLVRYVNANEIGKGLMEELKLARICSYILMMVNGVLSAAVLMMINYERGFEYKGFLIYVVALYTFYVTIICGIETNNDYGYRCRDKCCSGCDVNIYDSSHIERDKN